MTSLLESILWMVIGGFCMISWVPYMIKQMGKVSYVVLASAGAGFIAIVFVGIAGVFF